jgi:hypothetical protein
MVSYQSKPIKPGAPGSPGVALLQKIREIAQQARTTEHGDPIRAVKIVPKNRPSSDQGACGCDCC